MYTYNYIYTYTIRFGLIKMNFEMTSAILALNQCAILRHFAPLCATCHNGRLDLLIRFRCATVGTWEADSLRRGS